MWCHGRYVALAATACAALGGLSLGVVGVVRHPDRKGFPVTNQAQTKSSDQGRGMQLADPGCDRGSAYSPTLQKPAGRSAPMCRPVPLAEAWLDELSSALRQVLVFYFGVKGMAARNVDMCPLGSGTPLPWPRLHRCHTAHGTHFNQPHQTCSVTPECDASRKVPA